MINAGNCQTVACQETYPQLPFSGICRIFERLDGGECALNPLDGLLCTIPGWFLRTRSEKFPTYAEQFSGQSSPLERGNDQCPTRLAIPVCLRRKAL